MIETTRRTFAAGLAAAGIASTAAAAQGLAPMIERASATEVPDAWDYEYDVVVAGCGGAGLIAALKCAEEGMHVLAIDANHDIGGHAIVSGGVTHSGGGTSYQAEQGIEDSPDQYYTDHTDPTCSDSRYNKREVIRECADRMAECFDWMVDYGLKVTGDLVNGLSAGDCDTVARSCFTDGTGLTNVFDGHVCDGIGSGSAVTRPFEEAARELGVDFMMNRHLDALVTDETGRVVGMRASYTPRFYADGTQLVGEHADRDLDETRDQICVHASQAVIVATGGGSGNTAYRQMFDPAWGPQMDGCAGEPWSFQDASGEIAAMAVGAGLGSTANWTYNPYMAVFPAGKLGCRYTYPQHRWDVDSPIFEFCGARGISGNVWDGSILVNMEGRRFYNENADFNEGMEERDRFVSAALGSVVLDAGTGNAQRVGGPIWCIFDATHAKEMFWDDLEWPNVDRENGYFFEGATIEELASNIVNKYYEDRPMDPQVLAQTIEHYNQMVDAGEDDEFGKPAELMTKKIETGPFYAAWAMPNMHDCTTGIDTDAHRQALRPDGTVIPGLFACGECAGGHRTHGLGRVQTSGYIAALYACEG